MELEHLRQQIDLIDDELVSLFVQRMVVASQIAEYKKRNNLPVLVPERELEKLEDVAAKAGPEMAAYTRRLYSTLFGLSRSYQEKLNGEIV